VGNVRNDGPELIKAIAKAPPKDYRIASGTLSVSIGDGDSGARVILSDSRDDRHIGDSGSVHGG